MKDRERKTEKGHGKLQLFSNIIIKKRETSNLSKAGCPEFHLLNHHICEKSYFKRVFTLYVHRYKQYLVKEVRLDNNISTLMGILKKVE